MNILNENLRALIQSYIEEKKKSTNFSLRKFASSVSVSPSTISGFLNNKRGLSEKLAKRVLGQLDIDPKIKAEYLKGYYDKSHFSSENNTSFEIFKMLSDWRYYAVLAILETKSLSPSIDQIAQRLNLNVESINEVMSKLISERIIVQRDDTYLVQKHLDEIKINPFIKSLARRELNFQGIKLSEKKISRANDNSDHNNGFYLTLTVPGSKKEEAKMKDYFEKIVPEIKKNLNPDSSDEVYQINIQFFKVSR